MARSHATFYVRSLGTDRRARACRRIRGPGGHGPACPAAEADTGSRVNANERCRIGGRYRRRMKSGSSPVSDVRVECGFAPAGLDGGRGLTSQPQFPPGTETTPEVVCSCQEITKWTAVTDLSRSSSPRCWRPWWQLTRRRPRRREPSGRFRASRQKTPFPTAAWIAISPSRTATCG